MPAIDHLLREGAERLARAGVHSPRFEARLLLEEATGLAREQLLIASDKTVGVIEAHAFRTLCARRAAREPMAYIRGRSEFFGLEFKVGRGVLVPRPETETLVEVARLTFTDEDRPLRVLDLGTGSGCLLVTLLTIYRRALGCGTDLSEAALLAARGNAVAHGVAERTSLRRASWGEGIEGPFDLIVANPPYVRTDELGGLEAEVARFEPKEALDGGPDGLGAYRAIAPDIRRLLARGGVAAVELGRGQEVEVSTLFASEGLTSRHFYDLAQIVRCLELRHHPESD